VVARTTSALLLWLTGAPDRAADRGMQALELARQLHHPYTLAYAHFHVGLLHLWRRELELVDERAQAALEVAREHDYPIWQAVALVLQGTAMAGLGRPEEGLARTEQGTALYQGLTTPPVFWPIVLSIRAGVLAAAGQPAEGLALIDQALGIVGEALLYPEFALLKGDLLLAVSDPGGAEPWFRGAFDVAERHGMRMSQLRAATRLTHLQRAAGQATDGTETLRRVYETFTEGFETADLVEARALLTEGATRAV
jgi:tetratricopeptide (TPR) repeat protein